MEEKSIVRYSSSRLKGNKMEDSDIQIGDKVKIIGATNFNDEKGIVVASKTIRG